MGIDYCACFADVMEWKDVRNIAPRGARRLVAVLEKYQGGETAEYLLGRLAKSVSEDLSGGPASKETPHELIAALDVRHAEEGVLLVAKEILSAFIGLCDEFRLNTTVEGGGLELSVGYHDSKSHGCRGDEVDGVYYFIADGAWQLTPAGRKFHTKFARRYFTAWG